MSGRSPYGHSRRVAPVDDSPLVDGRDAAGHHRLLPGGSCDKPTAPRAACCHVQADGGRRRWLHDRGQVARFGEVRVVYPRAPS